ncbi:MAG: hypothetical protein AB7U82_04750 [Blastocatellales bacterium]
MNVLKRYGVNESRARFQPVEALGYDEKLLGRAARIADIKEHVGEQYRKEYGKAEWAMKQAGMAFAVNSRC